jgi:putative acetyltransferase
MSDEVRIECADPYGEAASALIAQLSAELAVIYPDDAAAGAGDFDPSDAAGPDGRFLVAWSDSQPIGCAALRRVGDSVAELKRLYVVLEMRGHGISRRLLFALEQHARELGYERVLAETGLRQPRSLALLESAGFVRVANYGIYIGNPLSACFEKELT